MLFFLLFVLSMFVASVLWWIWADVRLRRLPRPRVWRCVLAAFMISCIGGYWAVIGTRIAGSGLKLPAGIVAITIVWHLGALPLAVAIVAASTIPSLARSVFRRSRPAALSTRDGASTGPSPMTPPPELMPALSRRQLLTRALVAAPPTLTIAGLGKGFTDLESFRVRRLDVPAAGLPRELDGITIVHVSDVHIGHFTKGRILRKIVDGVNALRADLVVMTGDIIDYDLADLPAGLDVLRHLEGRHGLYACEGNHDLFMSRSGFELGMRNAGIPLLVNESRMVRVRGTPVQILGLRWGIDRGRNASLEQNASAIEPLIDRDAFPILLAHHPHAFDLASRMGIPLTFAGHTHGGQVMLRDDVGPGPIMYRYWSGLYRNQGDSLVVSNGVGNWFPVRFNAPAEIIHATLRRTDA